MLKFIGNGSAFNVERGNNSAFYIKGEEMLLIDCGSNIFERILKANLLQGIKHIHILVTHTHADHVGSLADLILYTYYSHGEFAKIKVNVYSTHWIGIEELLKLNGVIESEHYYYNELRLNKETNIGICYVTAVPSIHVKELSSNSYIIKIYNKKIYYSGDLNVLHKVDRAMINLQEYDYSYIDTCKADYEGNVHLSLRKLSEAIKPDARHKVWCMHLDNGFDIDEAKKLGFNVTKNIFE